MTDTAIVIVCALFPLGPFLAALTLIWLVNLMRRDDNEDAATHVRIAAAAWFAEGRSVPAPPRRDLVPNVALFAGAIGAAAASIWLVGEVHHMGIW